MGKGSGKLMAKKGFGIVETLIASAIIMVILFALTSAGRAAIRSNQYFQERAQATFLAQEGLELTRQIRDTYWIDQDNTTNWETFSSMIGSDRSLNFSEGRYSLVSTPGIDTTTLAGIKYTRTISFAANSIPDDVISLHANDNSVHNAVKVTVRINWNSTLSNSKSISLSEVLTNWRPAY